LSDVSAAQLKVFAKYAPEFQCLTRGIVNAGKLQAEAFRGFELHIVLEPLPNQPRHYTPQDKPRYGEKRGPSCLHLPNPPWSQENPLPSQPNMNDGVDEPTGKGTSRVAPNYYSGAGMVGSAQESLLLKSLLGPSLGVASADVPDLGVLLLGPMARGAEVSLR
uniref:MCE family protein n=1 Tax=Nocardioides sp. TaxID=35761 RepID=UPI003568D8DB